MSISREDFAGTTKAKSDQMNAVDLVGGPAAFRITDIRATGSPDQPIAISVDGHAQPWKPSKTFRRVLLLLWPNTEPSDWVGRDVVLWCDPEIKWAGEKVGGIAISHASHIDERKVYKLAESSNKRKTITIDPYRPQAQADPVKTGPVYWPDDKFENQITRATGAIQSGDKTADEIIAALEKKALLTAGQKARLKSIQAIEPEPEPAPEMAESDDPFADQ